jgi:hypothetical protein
MVHKKVENQRKPRPELAPGALTKACKNVCTFKGSQRTDKNAAEHDRSAAMTKIHSKYVQEY